ncbi:MAG: DegQ family serine endoprotease [Burkholderiaceae bacterium]|nr:DegQ family serine endoprotease [Burkholderiaceae bacterium]MEB2320786.1 DegQ family serine endoprotease [Pseudomonadota bacterium]
MKKLLLSLLLGPALALGLVSPGAADTRGLPQFADLVERIGPSVVNIRTAERVRERPGVPQLPPGITEDHPFYEFFRRFFPPGQSPVPPGQPGTEVPRGLGSGFIVSSDGLVLTNHHVVDGADEIYVTLTDKREFKAELIGSDRRTDVALIRIDAKGLPAVEIGDPERLRVGDWVLAIGSPFGLDSTVTAGIVSAKGRDTGEYLPFIQTDVAVNPGNSGGPLIDMEGKVVGINSQIYSRTGGFMGISFAIPIDEAMGIADQLKASGRVVRGRIGVGIAEVTKEVAEPLGLPNSQGALVRSVEAGGPAEKAGVEVGDIIVGFNGRKIERSSDLPRIVGGTAPGAKADIRVWRRGQYRDLTVTVGEMESDRQAKGPEKQAPEAVPAANPFGLGVADLTAEQSARLRVDRGVVVETVTGPAESVGIRPGDIILGINNQEVTGAKQFNELVARIDRNRTHVLLIRRGDSAQFVPIRPTAP